MTKDLLIKFCEENKLWLPSGASLDVINATIFRFVSSQKENVKKESCFGYWSRDDSECLVCDFNKECALASLGTSPKEYIRKAEKLVRPTL